MTTNPHLQIFVANGYYDLATPFLATEYTFSHMELDPSLRAHIHTHYYEAGHMMYAHLPSLMKLKDDFLASVSHDLKTPLFTVIGFLEMLDEGRLSDPAARKDLLACAIHDADRLKTLMNDLLDMSRFEAGRLKLTVEPIEVSDLVSEALASVNLLATSKGVTLKSTSPEGAIGIQGDRQRLLRVLINLIENAIKFSESGQLIEVCWGADNGNVEINVIDQNVLPLTRKLDCECASLS